MSSAENTHPIEWRDAPENPGDQSAHLNGEIVGEVFPSGLRPGKWSAWFRRNVSALDYPGAFPTASAARSFVEKSVKEAGHGE